MFQIPRPRTKLVIFYYTNILGVDLLKKVQVYRGRKLIKTTWYWKERGIGKWESITEKEVQEMIDEEEFKWFKTRILEFSSKP